MPMMPMDPAKAVRVVRPFLVNRFLRDSPKEVSRDMEGLRIFLPRVASSSAASAARSASSSAGDRGFESLVSSPSSTRMMREEYCSARAGLWVTMTISRSRLISFSRSMTWTLVSVSRAPVGSSARMMSGLLTIARAMATRCIWPPDISLGRLNSWLPRPTFSSASMARSRRSARLTPDRVRASSTFRSTVWWGIRL